MVHPIATFSDYLGPLPHVVHILILSTVLAIYVDECIDFTTKLLMFHYVHVTDTLLPFIYYAPDTV